MIDGVWMMKVMALMRCRMCGGKKHIPINLKSGGQASTIEDAKKAITKESVAYFKFHECGECKIGIMQICGAEMVE